MTQERIGKYDIVKLLGKGATGTVYHAVDSFSGNKVALKVIDPEVFRDPEFGSVYRAQFLTEASLAGKLKHPHIVCILDAVVEENSGHIAMELVTGGDLSGHTSPDKLLRIADVLQIGFKCCGALNYAFHEGIVHRDIKPANIMILQGTDVKISDFGAALLKKTQATQAAVMGSPFYMSPEQIQDLPLTHHSDMYCLGVVLYELLTGRRPFIAESLQELARMIINDPPEPPSSLRTDLPKPVDGVILRALGKMPEHRYETWADFELALSNVCKFFTVREGIPDSEKFVALKGVDLFAELSDGELWELAKAGTWARIPRGESIIEEGQMGKSFYFLGDGQVKVTRGGRLLNVIGKRECFGEMAYIRGGATPRQATVETITDVLLAQFDPEAIERISVSAQLALMRALVRNLVDRLEFANTRLA